MVSVTSYSDCLHHFFFLRGGYSFLQRIEISWTAYYFQTTHGDGIIMAMPSEVDVTVWVELLETDSIISPFNHFLLFPVDYFLFFLFALIVFEAELYSSWKAMAGDGKNKTIHKIKCNELQWQGYVSSLWRRGNEFLTQTMWIGLCLYCRPPKLRRRKDLVNKLHLHKITQIGFF